MPRPNSPAPFRPNVEGLEDRLTPATFTVVNENNHGAGSLRDAIIRANATPGADAIRFSIPGAGVHRILLKSRLPALAETVTIDGTTQPGFTNPPLIVLDGRGAGAANGLVAGPAANGCTIRGLVVSRFALHGVLLQSDGNTVSGCYIGTTSDGQRAAPNRLDGVNVAAGASGNTVGGATGGNLIAANGQFGVNIAGAGADNNTVARNSIGDNGSSGVRVATGAKNNTIGGAAAGTGNTIIANKVHGILIAGVGTTGNTVSANFVGTNAAGTQAVKNAANGVTVTNGASGNRIGIPGVGNLFSGNARFGVSLTGAGTTGNTVQGNFIGLNGAGTAAIANKAGGVNVAAGADGNTIGGTVAGATNVISGNTTFGVLVNGADGTLIQQNRIGTKADGSGAVANGSHGVFVTGGAANTAVGGTATGAGNVVANNAGNGVLIGSDPAAGFSTPAGAGSSVLGNSIHSNTRLGIDLGANNGVSLPRIPVSVTAATIITNATQIQVTVALANASPNTTYRVEVFVSPTADPSGFGEGQFVLGSIQVTTDAAGQGTGNGTFTYAAAGGTRVAATATSQTTNETSEFSAVFTAT